MGIVLAVIGVWLVVKVLGFCVRVHEASQDPLLAARLRYEQIRAERVMEYLYHRSDDPGSSEKNR